MRILVVGGTGFLGAELVRQATTHGHLVAATCFTRPGAAPEVDWRALDIRDRAAVARLVDDVAPDVVVNAAYRQSDWTTTAVGAANVALATAPGIRLVQVSSDAVFSGAAVTYAEDAVPDPDSPYGAAKAAAEVTIQATNPTAVIARTSLIIGDGGSPHEALVHTLASGDRPGILFTDDVRCPVHVTDLAAALLELAGSGRAGVHHLAGTDVLSRYELGLLIAARDGLDPARLPSGTRADVGLPGRRDVRLDCAQTQRHLKTRLRGAREFLS
uniref:SDR family oxidoreductase n=1 Tax=Herbidospora sakaeratensis TaxID=564415 RepID=UPI0007866979|nr:sugar nucleotide-binding protein [Herbidospora sakaeratensis]